MEFIVWKKWSKIQRFLWKSGQVLHANAIFTFVKNFLQSRIGTMKNRLYISNSNSNCTAQLKFLYNGFKGVIIR